ncbi:hypothetical protein TD95_001746 [Thielaviopsis punctulata]|uniref:Cytochrome P450 n=1 Tax=Thielaviopsis punctulata TaxID=72032 RepID=A0A0F4ZCR6_9PEZI|nr:hypothetical protein TD95_001746 [Thielaviopsis punctulata]
MALVQAIPPAILWAAILSSTFLVLFALFHSPSIKRHGRPLRRAPNALPLAGNGLLFLLRDRFALFDWFTRCERRFGYETLQVSVPSLPPGVIISSPENLEYVFKHEGIFSKGAFFKERSWDLFGHGIINVDGPLWKVQRRAGLAFLSTSNLKILTEEELPRILACSIARLTDAAESCATVDMQLVFHEITTQLMGRMAYGMEMHADDTFTRAFEFASGATAERVQNPLWKATELVTGRRMRASIAQVRQYGHTIVSHAVAARRAATGPTPSGSLIHSLLDAIADEQLVADAALNYLSAGRDTTAQALTWTFLLLAQHPAAKARLVAEIRSSLNNGHHALLSFPYTLAVFYEALRLYPPVPFELKQAEQPTTLPDGTFLPAKSIVLWCPWAMNRSYTTWGEGADEFCPERWLVPVDADAEAGDGQSVRVMAKSAAEFPVFNGGPRTCLGKKMAEAVAVRTIVTVLEQFDFDLRCDPNRRSGSSLTLPMEGGLPCVLTLRPTEP